MIAKCDRCNERFDSHDGGVRCACCGLTCCPTCEDGGHRTVDDLCKTCAALNPQFPAVTDIGNLKFAVEKTEHWKPAFDFMPEQSLLAWYLFWREDVDDSPRTPFGMLRRIRAFYDVDRGALIRALTREYATS